jgi:hypothetical protein
MEFGRVDERPWDKVILRPRGSPIEPEGATSSRETQEFSGSGLPPA